MPVQFWYAALYRKEKDNMSKSYKKNPRYTLELSIICVTSSVGRASDF